MSATAHLLVACFFLGTTIGAVGSALGWRFLPTIVVGGAGGLLLNLVW